MKNIKFLILVIVLIIMILLTSIAYNSLINEFVFAGGSIDSMMEYTEMNITFTILLLILFGISSYFYYIKPNNKKIIVLISIFIVWFLSGRTIGSLIWPEGKIFTGWFYISTENFSVCNDKVDCETTIYYRTKVEKLFFWRIKFKNKAMERVIFVGPFQWNKTLKLFEEFGNGKYTQ